eukprot:gene3837-6997_t
MISARIGVVSLLISIACGTYSYCTTDGSLEAIIHDIMNNKIFAVVHGGFFYVLLLVIGEILARFFVGKIRMEEKQALKDNMIYYALFNFVFIFYVLSPSTFEESIVWISWFTIIGFFKIFSIITSQRTKYVSSAVIQSKLVHQKLVVLIFFILLFDIIIASFAFSSFENVGIATIFLLIFNCWIIFQETLLTLFHFSMFLVDFYFEADNQSNVDFIYYFDFFLLFMGDITTILHFVHIWYVHNFSFSIVDFSLFMLFNRVLNSLKKTISKAFEYYKLTSIIDMSYPNVSEDEFEPDQKCTICLESLTTSSKKLKCSHIYHAHCIKRWIQDSKSCPVCRFAIETTTFDQINPSMARFTRFFDMFDSRN